MYRSFEIRAVNAETCTHQSVPCPFALTSSEYSKDVACLSKKEFSVLLLLLAQSIPKMYIAGLSKKGFPALLLMCTGLEYSKGVAQHNMYSTCVVEEEFPTLLPMYSSEYSKYLAQHGIHV